MSLWLLLLFENGALILCLQVGEAEHAFEPRTIQRMELLLLSALKWRMKAVTPLSYIEHGGHILGLEKQLHGAFIMRSSELALCTVKGMHVYIHVFTYLCYRVQRRKVLHTPQWRCFCYCADGSKLL